MEPPKKNLMNNHLSPSRRRALRPFFVQVRMYCKRACSPGGPWGSAGDRQFHSVQSFDEKCSTVALGALDSLGRAIAAAPRFYWAKNWKTSILASFPFCH